jgi:hypothetical protein
MRAGVGLVVASRRHFGRALTGNGGPRLVVSARPYGDAVEVSLEQHSADFGDPNLANRASRPALTVRDAEAPYPIRNLDARERVHETVFAVRHTCHHHVVIAGKRDLAVVIAGKRDLVIAWTKSRLDNMERHFADSLEGAQEGLLVTGAGAIGEGLNCFDERRHPSAGYASHLHTMPDPAWGHLYFVSPAATVPKVTEALQELKK